MGIALSAWDPAIVATFDAAGESGIRSIIVSILLCNLAKNQKISAHCIPAAKHLLHVENAVSQLYSCLSYQECQGFEGKSVSSVFYFSSPSLYLLAFPSSTLSGTTFRGELVICELASKIDKSTDQDLM